MSNYDDDRGPEDGGPWKTHCVHSRSRPAVYTTTTTTTTYSLHNPLGGRIQFRFMELWRVRRRTHLLLRGGFGSASKNRGKDRADSRRRSICVRNTTSSSSSSSSQERHKTLVDNTCERSSFYLFSFFFFFFVPPEPRCVPDREILHTPHQKYIVVSIRIVPVFDVLEWAAAAPFFCGWFNDTQHA